MSFSLSGIASGLDTNTIISQLMEIERVPYTKLKARQSTYASEQSIFRNINTKLFALRSAAEDLKLSANFNLRSATISNSSVLKATVAETAAENEYDIEVEQLATRATAYTKGFSAAGDELKGKQISIAVDGNSSISIALDKDTNEENLQKLADEVNRGNYGVKATLIEVEPGKKAIMFSSDKTGKDYGIGYPVAADSDSGESQPDAGGASFTPFFAIDDNSGNQLLAVTVGNAGSNAKLKINGVPIQSSTNEVKDILPGVSLTLSATGSTTLTVARDADKIADKVEAFVKAYNDVVSTIRTNTAKGAVLQGDATLRSLQDTLYGLFNSRVDGSSFAYLYEIGLEIDKGITKGSEMTGTISFDREKFKAKLAEDSDAVYKLFASDAENGKGIAYKFSETLNVWSRSGSGIIAAKIEGYDQMIDDLKKQMEAMELRLQMKEDQLKKRFNNMETALLTLQNQMSWLTSQISSLSTSTSI